MNGQRRVSAPGASWRSECWSIWRSIQLEGEKVVRIKGEGEWAGQRQRRGRRRAWAPQEPELQEEWARRPPQSSEPRTKRLRSKMERNRNQLRPSHNSNLPLIYFADAQYIRRLQEEFYKIQCTCLTLDLWRLNKSLNDIVVSGYIGISGMFPKSNQNQGTHHTHYLINY